MKRRLRPSAALLIALITATCGDDRSPTLPTIPDVASVTVTGTLTSPGFSAPFSALGRRLNDSIFDATLGAVWSSSNPAVASIQAAGVVKTEGTGEVDIIANYQGVKGLIHLVVPDVIALEVTGSPSNVGFSAQYKAIASLSNDRSQDVSPAAEWSSSNPNVVHSVGAGVVTSVAPGHAELSAIYMGKTARSRITVVGRARCGAAAGPSNRLLPLFASPFSGSYGIINYVDHASPIGFSDSNGYQLNACGDADPLRTDGHAGVDYALPAGTPVFAAAAGRVLHAGETAATACPPLGGQVRNTLVAIRHVTGSGDVFDSHYYHLSRIDVQAGEQLILGQTIGLSGGVGCTVGDALHFEVRQLYPGGLGETFVVDPYGWEADGPDPWASHDQGGQSFWMWLPGKAPRIQ